MEPLELYSLHAHLIRRLQQISTSIWSKAVSEYITAPQFAILNYVLSNPNCDQKTLGNAVYLDRATTTEIVARMVKRNLVSRRKDPSDLRQWKLTLTLEGIEIHSQIVPLALNHNQLLLTALNQNDQVKLLAYLQTVCQPTSTILEPASQ